MKLYIYICNLSTLNKLIKKKKKKRKEKKKKKDIHEIFARTYFRESAIFSIFREDLFSRMAHSQTFREDLISRIWAKLAKFAKINPLKVINYA